MSHADIIYKFYELKRLAKEAGCELNFNDRFCEPTPFILKLPNKKIEYRSLDGIESFISGYKEHREQLNTFLSSEPPKEKQDE